MKFSCNVALNGRWLLEVVPRFGDRLRPELLPGVSPKDNDRQYKQQDDVHTAVDYVCGYDGGAADMVQSPGEQQECFAESDRAGRKGDKQREVGGTRVDDDLRQMDAGVDGVQFNEVNRGND